MTIFYFWAVSAFFFTWESFLNLIQAFWDEFGLQIDLDFLTFTIFCGTLKIFLLYNDRVADSILKIDIKKENNGIKIDYYCRKVVEMGLKMHLSIKDYFLLYSLLAKHNYICADIMCPCHKMILREADDLDAVSKQSQATLQTNFNKASDKLNDESKGVELDSANKDVINSNILLERSPLYSSNTT